MSIKESKNLLDWFDQRLAVRKFLDVMMLKYYIPKKINFLWCMGVILLTLFGMLFLSGLMLMAYYKPDAKLAFDSVNFTIMQEVSLGWLWRHIHAVSASVIFLILYIHMFVAIFYRSYKNGREMIWIGGVILFLAFSLEAFSGYILPWGQMSYWAAMVITNLFGQIPIIGDSLVFWIRGDYAVSDATLTRFFMLHVCLMPIVIISLIAFHLYSLRFPHVNNEDGEEFDFDIEGKKFESGDEKGSKVVPFWPGFMSKDLYYVGLFLVFFFFLVGFNYTFAMDPINFDPANYTKTPNHIYPEWYFLWQYEILRGFFFDIGPIKASSIGFICFGYAGISMMLIPFLDRNKIVAPATKSKGFLIWFWLLIFDMIMLSIFGKLPADKSTLGINNTHIGFVFAISYLILTLVVLPIVTIIEARRNK